MAQVTKENVVSIHYICGYGMVFERKIKYLKNQENCLPWPFTLLIFYEVSANISGIQTKGYLNNPSHIWIVVYCQFLKWKHFLAPSLTMDGTLQHHQPSYFFWETRFNHHSWNILWLIWKDILWMLARKRHKKKMSCQPLEEYQLWWVDS